MRRLFFIALQFLLLGLPFMAQEPNRIKSDPSYIWAEGEGRNLSEADAAAVDALIRKLSGTSYLQASERIRLELWRTYRSEIITASRSLHEGGHVLRYMKWDRIPFLFESRRKRVEELLSFASAAGDDVARTYLDWAEVYLRSLPKDQDLIGRLQKLKAAKGDGTMAEVRMLHIQREVESIRALTSSPSGSNAIATAKGNRDRPSTELRDRPATVVELVETTLSSPSTPLRDHGHLLQRHQTINSSLKGLAETGSLSTLNKRPAVDHVLAQHSSKEGCLYITAQVGCGYGLGIGYRWGSLGAYASARSDFGGVRSEYSCRQDGTTDFGYIWTSGESRRGRYSLTAGGIVALTRSLDLTIGAGYGSYSTFWEDTSGRWSLVEDLLHRGVLLEGGAMYSIKRITLQAGCSLIELKKACPFVGIGVNLGHHDR